MGNAMGKFHFSIAAPISAQLFAQLFSMKAAGHVTPNLSKPGKQQKAVHGCWYDNWAILKENSTVPPAPT
jgi:hypothetical protein